MEWNGNNNWYMHTRRVYFRGSQGKLLGNWLSLYLIWGCPPPPLKFAAMYLPPLERNPEINPAHVQTVTWLHDIRKEEERERERESERE
jgi:hypothetical protein